MMRAFSSALAVFAFSPLATAQAAAPPPAGSAIGTTVPGGPASSAPPAPPTPPASTAPTQPPAVPPPAPGVPPSAPAEPPGPYYIEPPRAPGSEVSEPPPPGYEPPVIFEPPPPPSPRHVAPRNSLWLGVRLGWFMPFGNVYARATAVGAFVEQRGVPIRDYLSSGPLVEADLGARLSRNYNVFALWERAELGSGNGDSGLLGQSTSSQGGNSDFWAVGMRASSDPDRVGFLTEIAIGYRRARAEWDDGTALEMTQGLFEGRLGFGADIRVNRSFTLSPMLTFGVGLFGRVELVDADGVSHKLILAGDDQDGHGSFTLQVGAHFDLLGSR